jgi:hypothetical protein
MLVLCSEAPLAVLFYSIEMTDQLCFITWSHAYSLLPYPTFVKRKTYVLEPFMNQDRNGVAHLLQNGRRAGLTIESVDVRDTQCDKSPISNPHWQLENYHQSRVDHNGNSKERCVSDKHSWMIPLNTEGVIPSIDRATFRISPVSHPNAGDLTTTLPFVSGHYRIHFEVVSAPCLKYKYFTIPCDHTKQATHVCPERYTHISALQIESMEIKDRPPGYATLAAADYSKNWEELAGPGYSVPSYWKYYDDEVEKILEYRWGTNKRRGRFDGDSEDEH